MYEKGCGPSNQLIVKRFFLLVVGLFLGAYVFSAGLDYFKGRRYILGSTLVIMGVFVYFGGLFLFLSTASPLTWGWFL